MKTQISKYKNKIQKANYDQANERLKKFKYAFISILLGLVFGMILIAILGSDPFAFVAGIFKGSFQNITSFGNFLGNFSWLLLLGLSVGLAMKLGIFNIGVPSQFMLGGITGFFWAYYVNIGRFGVIFSILIPILSGALLGWIIGYLKAKRNINEIVTSIMLNWIIYWFYNWVTDYSLHPVESSGWVTSTGASDFINPNNSLRTENLTKLFGENSSISMGIFLALIIFFVIWFVMKKTQWGKQIEITGSNPDAAVYAGYNKNKNIILVMSISGALAGLAGSVFYLGSKELLTPLGSDIPTEAWNGISIALIGFMNPGGIFAASLFISLLNTSQTLLQTFISIEIINLTNGIIIWFIAISNYFIVYEPTKKLKIMLEKIKKKKENNVEKEINLELTENKKSTKKDSIVKKQGDK